jgi:hypothetical protein
MAVMSAKPISPAAWHPLDALIGGAGFSRACEALCGGAQTAEAQAAIQAASEARRAAAHMQSRHHVESGVAAVIAMLLAKGGSDIESTLAQIGLVLIEAARAAALLKGLSPTAEIGAEVDDEAVLRALNQIQRGH